MGIHKDSFRSVVDTRRTESLHIRILTPVVAGPAALSDHSILSPFRHVASSRLILTARLLEDGPEKIAGVADELECIGGLRKLARAAADERVDGILIDCMADPGVRELREVVSIPVFGPAEVALAHAHRTSRRFAIVVPYDVAAEAVDDQVASLGFRKRYAGHVRVRSSIADAIASPRWTMEALIAGCREAIDTLGARLIVLGCTSWTGLAPAAETRLRKKGLPVQVVDPMMVSVKALEAHLRRAQSLKDGLGS